MTEIAKCPFCGGNDVRVYDEAWERRHFWLRARCDCGAAAPVVRQVRVLHGVAKEPDHDAAIEAWNRRTPQGERKE